MNVLYNSAKLALTFRKWRYILLNAFVCSQNILNKCTGLYLNCRCFCSFPSFFVMLWFGLAWPGLEMKFVAHNLPNCITSNCGAFFLTLPLHHTYMHKVQCKLYIDNVPCTCMHSTLAEHLIYDSVVPLFVLLVFSLCWFYVCKLTWLRNVSFLFLVCVRLVYSIYNVIAKIYNSNY